ncbi:IclR family transcriptional regulator [Haloplanus halophilus]|uniref:IclR family transcriptional regulator n=1 Tax=Haloplanus halophilus TaxID=2949993 RepID=UPI00203EE5E8|nr:helix-turn-helix domain-containing protein [Haloplanus sp. GDY1]
MEDTIQSVERSFELIDALLELDGAGVTELAEHLNISASGTYKHLTTLRELGYLEKRDGTYEVSYELFSFGARVRRREPLYEVGREPLDQLARVTYTRTNLYVRERQHAVCLYSTFGGQDGSTESTEGRAIALEDSAVGRVMRSHGENRDVPREWADGPESGLTVVDDHQVGIETEDERRRIAVEIGGSDRVRGSIEVLAPIDQIEGRLVDEDILSMMVSTAETIESRL